MHRLALQFLLFFALANCSTAHERPPAGVPLSARAWLSAPGSNGAIDSALNAEVTNHSGDELCISAPRPFIGGVPTALDRHFTWARGVQGQFGWVFVIEEYSDDPRHGVVMQPIAPGQTRTFSFMSRDVNISEEFDAVDWRLDLVFSPCEGLARIDGENFYRWSWEPRDWWYRVFASGRGLEPAQMRLENRRRDAGP